MQVPTVSHDPAIDTSDMWLQSASLPALVLTVATFILILQMDKLRYQARLQVRQQARELRPTAQEFSVPAQCLVNRLLVKKQVLEIGWGSQKMKVSSSKFGDCLNVRMPHQI